MEADSLKGKLTENLDPIPPVGVWVKLKAVQPKPGMVIVKFWGNGGYWAGTHDVRASLNFEEWMRLR